MEYIEVDVKLVNLIDEEMSDDEIIRIIIRVLLVFLVMEVEELREVEEEDDEEDVFEG